MSSVQLGVDAIPTVCGQGCPTQRFIIHSCVQFRPFPLHSAPHSQVLDDVICPLHISYHIVLDIKYCQTPVLGLGLGVDFTFSWDNDNNNNNHNNPHLNFVKGTVLGDKEQGIRDKG